MVVPSLVIRPEAMMAISGPENPLAEEQLGNAVNQSAGMSFSPKHLRFEQTIFASR
jgi:hypothetical protein